MANPSTTGPSGIGSEVLRRCHTITAVPTMTSVLTVGTDMIVTILSMIVANNATGSWTNYIHVFPDGGSECTIVTWNQTNAGTFIFNDKLVLVETDVLKLETNCTDSDVYVSYIEQEFA